MGKTDKNWKRRCEECGFLILGKANYLFIVETKRDLSSEPIRLCERCAKIFHRDIENYQRREYGKK